MTIFAQPRPIIVDHYLRVLLLCVLRLSRFNSLLDNNPLECDCAIMTQLYEQATVTGTCAYPHHLRGVNVSTLHAEDFQCGMSSKLSSFLAYVIYQTRETVYIL